MTEKDTYKTIATASAPVLFKNKKCKFFGYAFPVLNEGDIKYQLEKLKKEHPSARHWYYSYQIGIETITYRSNDDGEPNNSAGLPIYGQIQSFGVTNILIVVVRYFGGVKLGVGGLINAYRSTAQMALEQSRIIEKTIHVAYVIAFDYKTINTVMRIVKEKNLDVTDQILELDCQITISVRKNEAASVFKMFDHLVGISIGKKIVGP